jgi:hypothetical protein
MNPKTVCTSCRRDLAYGLLISGRVRITDLWPRALNAEISTDGQLHRITVRPTAWTCTCGSSNRTPTFCAHALADRLVAGDSIPGPFTEVWP